MRVRALSLRRCAAAFLATTSMPVHAAAAQEAGPPPGDEPIPARAPSAPQTGSATLSLVVVVDGAAIGNANATFSETELLAISAQDIARLLGDDLREDTLLQLRALGSGLVPPRSLPEGLVVELDPATFALATLVDQRIRRSRAYAASGDYQIAGAQPIGPAPFAAGVTASLVSSAPVDDLGSALTTVAFSGFANLGGVRGLNLDYSGNIGLGDVGGREFQRGRLTLFKDWPEQALRLASGDLVPQLPRLAGRGDILGLSIARDYAALQPLRNIRPTLARSVVLEQRSIVEVYVNQALVERFQAGPGPIDITQIPLAATSNDVSIIVEDALGRREVENLTFGSDLSLLGTGIESFGAAVGVMRRPFRGFAYTDDPVATGYYQRGLSPSLTAGGHVVLSEDLQNAGVAAAFATPVGISALDVAYSSAAGLGSGAALGLSFRGSPFFGPRSDEIATVSFDYRTRQFSTFGQFGFLDTLKYDLRVDYEKSVGPVVSLFASMSQTRRYSILGLDRSVNLGARVRIAGAYLNAGLRYVDTPRQRDEAGAFVSLSVPLGRTANVTASYDSFSSRGRAEFRQRRGLDFPEVDYRVGATTQDGENTLFGGLGYATSRFAADADILSRMVRAGGRDVTTATVRLQSGVGFADGRVALGRDPGQGFAIVNKHRSLSGAELSVRAGSAGRELGSADALGPALVPVNTPFRPQIINIETENAPPGYDIGAGRYVLQPGARSGMRIKIGSDANRTVLTHLVFAGEPLALATGRFEPVGGEGPAGVFFTNRAGRAAFNALVPGRYRVEIEELQLEGIFEVPEESEQLLRLDSIEMRRK